jgi:hypothetical protein
VTRIPTVTPELVVSAYRATGLRPGRMVYRQGAYACPVGAIMACLGERRVGRGELARLAPPDLLPWWLGFIDGWDFAADVQIQRAESYHGLYRLGRGAGALIRAALDPFGSNQIVAP